MMIAPPRSIFRESALKKYRQRQEQGVLLRVASPPVMLFLWAVLLLLLGAGGFAWSIKVPVRVQGQGIIVPRATPGQIDGGVLAMLFFAPDQVANLHRGQAVTVSISSTTPDMPGSIAQVDTHILSPDEARRRFNLQGGLAQLVPGPSITVAISIGSGAGQRIYAGSLCTAQIQVGSRSVLSLLPGFNQLLGQ